MSNIRSLKRVLRELAVDNALPQDNLIQQIVSIFGSLQGFPTRTDGSNCHTSNYRKATEVVKLVEAFPAHYEEFAPAIRDGWAYFSEERKLLFLNLAIMINEVLKKNPEIDLGLKIYLFGFSVLRRKNLIKEIREMLASIEQLITETSTRWNELQEEVSLFDEDAPLISQFLNLFSKDIDQDPSILIPYTKELDAELDELLAGVEAD